MYILKMIKNNMILAICILLISCSYNKNTKQDKTRNLEYYFQSLGNKYLVEFVKFDEKLRTKISKELNKKTYKITKEGAFIQIYKKNEGHSFFVDKDYSGYNYIIKVENVLLSLEKFIVNIQVFINEKGQRKRFFNPGNFRIKERIKKSKEKDVITVLRNLIITLTFK